MPKENKMKMQKSKKLRTIARIHLAAVCEKRELFVSSKPGKPNNSI
jgi:hypothetical protein